MATLDERVAALEARLDTHVVNMTDLRGGMAELQGDMNRQFEHVRTEMNQRFEHVCIEMNQRFAEVNRRFEQVDVRFIAIDNQFAALEQHMNQRFDAVDQKIDRHFTWLIGIQVAVLVSVVGALVGSYFR